MPLLSVLSLLSKPPPSKEAAEPSAASPAVSRLIKTVKHLQDQRSENAALAAIDPALLHLARCCQHYDDIAEELRQCHEALGALLLMLRHTENAQCAARRCGPCWSLCSSVCRGNETSGDGDVLNPCGRIARAQASMCSGSKSGFSRALSTWSRQPPFR